MATLETEVTDVETSVGAVDASAEAIETSTEAVEPSADSIEEAETAALTVARARAPERPAFLSVVPRAFAEVRPPLAYRLLKAADVSEQATHRYAPSDAYRAHDYACVPFHRPLSKVLRRSS